MRIESNVSFGEWLWRLCVRGRRSSPVEATLWGLFLLMAVAGVWRASAQSAEKDASRLRVAIVAEETEVGPLADLLTAELTSISEVELIERDQIARVLKEQNLSAGNRNDLKLGRLLGADGLIFLHLEKVEGQNRLGLRLTAVKAGVVMPESSFAWPVKDAPGLAGQLGVQTKSLLPKLHVRQGDAIALSIVNFRTGTKSAVSMGVEHDLKVLAMERFSNEPRFFVMERERMDALLQEKGLTEDESKFWNGSYVLDATADRDGYAPQTMVMDIRLSPPQGRGDPLTCRISGPRTSPAALVNEMVVKVADSLNVGLASRPWNPEEEALLYFQEAQWALKWQSCEDASRAADVAWALGRHDKPTALLRQTAHLQRTAFPQLFSKTNTVEGALRNLDLYLELTGALGVTNLTVDSEWVDLGIESLNQGGEALKSAYAAWSYSAWEYAARDYAAWNQGSALRPEVALLRERARHVANWISGFPAIRDSYFRPPGSPGSRRPAQLWQYSPTDVFTSQAIYGRYWENSPEDCASLYLRLLSGPNLTRVHFDIWNQTPGARRILGWNADDRKRVDAVDREFKSALAASTNLLLILDAKTMAFLDATSSARFEAGLADFLRTFDGNIEELWDDSVYTPSFFFKWNFRPDPGFMTGGGATEPDPQESLSKFDGIWRDRGHRYEMHYWLRVDARKTATRETGLYRQLKAYLRAPDQLDPTTLSNRFHEFPFTPRESLEMLPHLALCRSNILEKMERAPANASQLRASAEELFRAEERLRRLIESQTALLAEQEMAESNRLRQRTPLGAAAVLRTNAAPATPAAGAVVMHYIPAPTNQLPVSRDMSGIRIFAHHVIKDKLWLGYTCEATNSMRWSGPGGLIARKVALGILDLRNNQWEIVPLPDNRIPMDFVMLDGTVYLLCGWYVDGALAGKDERPAPHSRLAEVRTKNSTMFGTTCEIMACDMSARTWRSLPFPSGSYSGIFVVAGRLFLVSTDSLQEYEPGSQTLRVLASSKRRPALTVLDTIDRLRASTIFPGSGSQVCVFVNKQVYGLEKGDWKLLSPRFFDWTPSVFEDGVLLRSTCMRDHSAGRNPNSLVRVSTDLYRASPGGAALDHIGSYENGFSRNDVLMWDSGQAFDSPVENARSNIVETNAIRAKPMAWRASNRASIFGAPALMVGDRQFYYFEKTGVEGGRDGYSYFVRKAPDAGLMELAPGNPEPLTAPLVYDWPVKTNGATEVWTERNYYWIPFKRTFPVTAPPVWTAVAGGKLIVGQNVIPGVWVAPFTEVEAVFDSEDKARKGRLEAEELTADADRKRLLDQFDANHDGTLDAGERGKALSEPRFVELELSRIDVNQNNRLDCEELACFDANRDRQLDREEEDAVRCTLHFLALRMMRQYGIPDGESLDAGAIREVLGLREARDSDDVWKSVDANHDGRLNLAELEDLEMKTLLESVDRAAGTPAPGSPSLKAAVDRYWSMPSKIGSQ